MLTFVHQNSAILSLFQLVRTLLLYYSNIKLLGSICQNSGMSPAGKTVGTPTVLAWSQLTACERTELSIASAFFDEQNAPTAHPL